MLQFSLEEIPVRPRLRFFFFFFKASTGVDGIDDPTFNLWSKTFYKNFLPKGEKVKKKKKNGIVKRLLWRIYRFIEVQSSVPYT
jgi:hypothetical protein